MQLVVVEAIAILQAFRPQMVVQVVEGVMVTLLVQVERVGRETLEETVMAPQARMKWVVEVELVVQAKPVLLGNLVQEE
jgi:Holliday junction resolvasome RuvABC DNA-binding subunit